MHSCVCVLALKYVQQKDIEIVVRVIMRVVGFEQNQNSHYLLILKCETVRLLKQIKEVELKLR